jgi:hypothetical protein
MSGPRRSGLRFTPTLSPTTLTAQKVRHAFAGAIKRAAACLFWLPTSSALDEMRLRCQRFYQRPAESVERDKSPFRFKTVTPIWSEIPAVKFSTRVREVYPSLSDWTIYRHGLCGPWRKGQGVRVARKRFPGARREPEIRWQLQFESLRDDARFKDLLKRMNQPD